MGITINASVLVSWISLITNVFVAVTSILNLIAFINTFEVFIINIYTFVIALVLFFMDINTPVACSKYFYFIVYYWGRGIIYLPLGCAIYVATAAFGLFASIWTIVIGFLFLLFAIAEKIRPGTAPNGAIMAPLWTGSQSAFSKAPSPPTRPKS